MQRIKIRTLALTGALAAALFGVTSLETASAASAGPGLVIRPDSITTPVRGSRYRMTRRCRYPANGNARFPSRRRDCRAGVAYQGSGTQTGGPARKLIPR